MSFEHQEWKLTRMTSYRISLLQIVQHSGIESNVSSVLRDYFYCRTQFTSGKTSHPSFQLLQAFRRGHFTSVFPPFTLTSSTFPPIALVANMSIMFLTVLTMLIAVLIIYEIVWMNSTTDFPLIPHHWLFLNLLMPSSVFSLVSGTYLSSVSSISSN